MNPFDIAGLVASTVAAIASIFKAVCDAKSMSCKVQKEVNKQTEAASSDES